MREARRWVDILFVLTSNAPISERRPGDRLLDTMAQRIAISEQAHNRLLTSDPELYRAVRRAEWEHSRRFVTYEAWTSWRARYGEQYRRRIAKLRAEMRGWGLKRLAPE
jgi:hypothetical protein